MEQVKELIEEYNGLKIYKYEDGLFYAELDCDGFSLIQTGDYSGKNNTYRIFFECTLDKKSYYVDVDMTDGTIIIPLEIKGYFAAEVFRFAKLYEELRKKYE